MSKNENIIKTLKTAKLAKIIGLSTVVIIFGALITWSALAPLEGAVIASGSVVVDTNRKTIQHLEGGIISEILVKDGDKVKLGDELIVLDRATAKSKFDLLSWRLKVEKATEGRLLAERADANEITFDSILLEKQDEQMHKILETQKNIFLAGREDIGQKTKIFNERIAQLNNQIKGIQAQMSAVREQKELIEEELETVESLLKRGLEQKPRYLSLKRKASELDGRVGEYNSMIAKAKDTINENKLNIFNLKTEKLNETVNELKEVQERIADIEERLFETADIYKRTVIVAPQDGVITGLRYHTIGGVIAPGSAILDIVPQNDALVVDVKLKPTDIDSVYQGQTAKVLLSAYKIRYIPRIKGDVQTISADRFLDEITGEYYYLVRVTVDEEELSNLEDNIDLYPGMPAEVFFVTGESTLFQYLFYPFKQSFRRAFREPQ